MLRSAIRQWLLPAACVLCAGIALTTSASEKETTRYFDQLRRRGLLQLAEGACRRELARKDLAPDQRSQYTLELSRTLAEQAKYAVGKEQTDLWKQAAGTIESHLRKSPKAPNRNWLQMQRCITLVLHGEFLRWDAELAAADSAASRRAAKALQRAVAELRMLEQSASQGDSTAERRELQSHIRYQSAIAYVLLAEVRPVGSAERKQALRQAAAALAPLVAQPASSVMAWNSRVLSARVLRLEGDLRRAADRLARVQKLKPPATVRHRIEGELVRLLLAKNLHRQAEEILRKLHQQRGSLPGEHAFLRVSALIALWKEARKAGDTRRAGSLFQQAEDCAAEADRTVGGYWSYRCRVLLGILKDAQQHGPEVAAAIRKAQFDYRANDWKAAADGYSQAAAIAAKSGDNRRAAQLAFTAGSIRLQAGEFERAADEFRRLARNHPGDSRAPEADLMAAYCLGRSYDSLRTKARRLAYLHALEDHRRKFSRSETIHEAAWMLATLHEYRGQTTEALKLYLSIPAKHARAPAAQLAAARSYETIITRLGELKKPDDRKAWETHASARLGEIIARFPKPPAVWDPSQTEIALRTARIHLNRSPPGHGAAEPLLEQVVASADRALSRKTPLREESRTFWTAVRGAARQLRIVSLAGTGRFEDARSLLAGLEKSSPKDTLSVLDGLMQIGSGSDAAVREKLGELQLRAALKLNRNRTRLQPAERSRLDRCLAQAYESAGRKREAMSAYEKLLENTPGNRKLLTKAASLLADSSDRELVRKGLTHWQTLLSLDKPGTAGWLEARYQIARCHYRLGEYAECRKLIAVSRLLYPQLGGDELRGRFEALLKDVDRERLRQR